MATAVDHLPDQPAYRTDRAPLPLVQIGWFLALILICYAPTLRNLGDQWMNDEDMGHGFFVPLVAGYIVWQRREELAAIPVKPNYWGLGLLLWGAFQLSVGTLGAELFLQRTAILFTLIGAILVIYGNKVLKAMAFPLFLLLFMIPIPRIIYTRITFPLQLFASRVAETLLNLINIPVLRDGNVLELASQKLSVVEACSGIRSLLSLSFLSLVYAYFFDPDKPWMKWALLAATIPIASLANAGRVTITGIISEYRTDLAQGFFHSLEGWLIFIVAMVLMIFAHRLINVIYNAIHAKQTRSAGLS